MTSAPISASIRVQLGPARARVRSRTRRSLRTWSIPWGISSPPLKGSTIRRQLSVRERVNRGNGESENRGVKDILRRFSPSPFLRFCLLPASVPHQSAVDVERLAGDVARLVRGQEGGH